MDQNELNEKKLDNSFDSSSTCSTDSGPYFKHHKTLHTIVHHGVARLNYDDLSVDSDRSDSFLDSNQDLSRRDMFISTLQNQLRKMEDMYKRKVDDSQLLRHKFCRTAQELSDLKKILQIYEDENVKLRDKDAPPQAQREMKESNKIENEYKELLKKIDTMENNTLTMKNLLELRSCDNPTTRTEIVYNSKTHYLDCRAMYKNIEAILKDHNDKFNLLAAKLNVQFDENHSNKMPFENTTSTSSQLVSEENLSSKASNDISGSENEISEPVQGCQIVKLRNLNESLTKELEQKTRLLDELTQKLQSLENQNQELQIELENTGHGNSSNMKELNKIQEDLQEGSKTLQMCLSELKMLKEQNNRCAEEQKSLEEENVDLKRQLEKVEEEVTNYRDDIEALQRDIKVYKDKEDSALFCICELKQRLEEKENLFAEKRQKYREKISNLNASEAALKRKLSDRKFTEKNLSEITAQRDSLNKLLDEKNLLVSELREKIKTLEAVQTEAQNASETFVNNLSLRFENLQKENIEQTETIQVLEEKAAAIEEDNEKLQGELKTANERLHEMEETEKTLQNEISTHKQSEAERTKQFEQEYKEVKALNEYFELQLKTAKEKYEELLPLADSCCVKHLTDIIYWFEKQYESLKNAHAKVVTNLEKKLNEARETNNISNFMVIKDILEFILKSMSSATNVEEMSAEIKGSFEKLIIEKSGGEPQMSQDHCNCPDKAAGLCHCKKALINTIKTSISTIIEEKEEDVFSDCLKEGELESQSKEKTSEEATDNKAAENDDKGDTGDVEKVASNESSYECLCTPPRKLSPPTSKTSPPPGMVTVELKQQCCNNNENRSKSKNENSFPYISLRSPSPSQINIKIQPTAYKRYVQSAAFAEAKTTQPPVEVEQTNAETYQSANKLISAEVTPSTSKTSTNCSSVCSTNSDPTVSICDVAAVEGNCSDSDAPQTPRTSGVDRATQKIDICCPFRNKGATSPQRTESNCYAQRMLSKPINDKLTSHDSTSKLDDYLSKLSKMERKVGCLRRELSAGRTNNKNSTSEVKKVPEPFLHKRTYAAKPPSAEVVNKNNQICHTKCSESPTANDCRRSRKDVKKPVRTPINTYHK